ASTRPSPPARAARSSAPTSIDPAPGPNHAIPTPDPPRGGPGVLLRGWETPTSRPAREPKETGTSGHEAPRWPDVTSLGRWGLELPGQDSNLEKQDQNLL